jgi:hypothetical protein
MDNSIHDAFDTVHSEESLKRSTKAFLASKVRAPQRISTTRRATAIACLVLVLLGIGGWRLYMTPISLISVDVNPSLELGVNCFDRIVSVTGYNEDGVALAASVDLRNLNYSDALDTLLSSEKIQSYRENNGLVSITVIGSTEHKSEEMRSKIVSCDYAASPNVECQSGNRKDVEAAHNAGLSLGKYRAFLDLHALDPTVTTEDIQDLTMRQIRNWIDKLSADSNVSQNSSSGGKGYGNQHHNGVSDSEQHYGEGRTEDGCRVVVGSAEP